MQINLDDYPANTLPDAVREHLREEDCDEYMH